MSLIASRVETFEEVGYEFAYDTLAGTPPFQIGETLTFVTPAGTAELLRHTANDDGLTGTMRIRLLTGTVPANDTTMTGGASGATAAVNGAVSSITEGAIGSKCHGYCLRTDGSVNAIVEFKKTNTAGAVIWKDVCLAADLAKPHSFEVPLGYREGAVLFVTVSGPGGGAAKVDVQFD